MARFKVRASALEGHKFYRCGGPLGAAHAWPRGDDPVFIEVVDQPEDPPKSTDHEVLQVGMKTYQELVDDKYITIVPAEDPLTLAEHAKEVEALRIRVLEIEARVIELEAENADLKAKLGGGEKKKKGES